MMWGGRSKKDLGICGLELKDGTKKAPQPANQSRDSELERERVGAEGFEPPTLCL